MVTWCQESIGGICFANKWRGASVQAGLGFDTFKPTLKSGIFECFSHVIGLFYGDDDWDFLKKGVKAYLMGQKAPQLES
jgi:hypothetical protein